MSVYVCVCVCLCALVFTCVNVGGYWVSRCECVHARVCVCVCVWRGEREEGRLGVLICVSSMHCSSGMPH